MFFNRRSKLFVSEVSSNLFAYSITAGSVTSIPGFIDTIFSTIYSLAILEFLKKSKRPE